MGESPKGHTWEQKPAMRAKSWQAWGTTGAEQWLSRGVGSVSRSIWWAP